MRPAIRLVVLALVLPGWGCMADSAAPPPGGPAAPGGEWENLAPVPNTNPEAAPQPFRTNPFAVAVSDDGRTAFVALRGNELEPSDGVAVVDVPGRAVAARLQVGAAPVAVRLRPQGDFAVVLSQLSPYAAVIDVARREVTGKLRVGYYAQDLAFGADGAKLYVTSRMEDAVLELDVTARGGTLEATPGRTAPAGTNPDGIGLSPDGSKLYVTDAGGLGIHVYDVATMTERAFLFLNAPVFDVKPMGKWVIATTLNDTNGLPCESDGDFPGQQGDGIFDVITDSTCSRGFADLQNELVFIDPDTDAVVIRYTSDSAEISEADREGDHPPELMQVVGALPQQIAVANAHRAYITMGSSFELVELEVDDATPPGIRMPRAWATGFAPRGLALTPDGLALVANKLSETLSVIDLASGARADVAVGTMTPTFPATSAEVGELFFHTSKYATDGDMSCTHCHPNVENDGKGWNVDVVRSYGRRSAMIMRNLFATRPLLIEGVFDENDFNLEMEGISNRADFHDSSYTLQVARRDEFYRQTSRDLIGREVGFQEMVGHVAAFLIVEPRLLPSPFPKDTPAVERGEALFSRPDVGCAACHPAPTFASPELFQGVTTLGRFDLPRRDLDPDISIKYIENARDGFFNANSLRGLWDRRGSFFHDGRARTIRETLLTPGHACLHEGERPFNEADGQVDTNGGVSQLTCDQIDDLVAFLKTID